MYETRTSALQAPASQAAGRQSRVARHGVRSALLAAVFMMATSSVGPGFLTQTTTFTVQMGASFAFAILVSVLIDCIVQLNVWRTIALTRRRAADIANAAIPGSGFVLAVLVIFGGLAFNVGNVAGAGLGLNAMIGLDPQTGAALSAVFAIVLFALHKLSRTLDRVIIALGLLMIGMTLYVAFVSQPPIGQALMQTVWPERISFAATVTIIGGTVGGYITYAGAHRLLDHGVTGKENLPSVTRGALGGILVTGLMRYVLFLAIFGVVASGAVITLSGAGANPAAQVFGHAAGQAGLRLFGLVLWAASITSVIGAAYTSITFVDVFKKGGMTPASQRMATAVFILIGLLAYLALGKTPTALLVFAGGFNGLILPLGLTIFVYIGWRRTDLMQGHSYSRVFLCVSAAVCLLTWYMGIASVKPIFDFLLL